MSRLSDVRLIDTNLYNSTPNITNKLTISNTHSNQKFHYFLFFNFEPFFIFQLHILKIRR